MPDFTLSDAIREAYAANPSSVVVFDTIELRHPAFLDDAGNPTSIRLVNDKQNLTAGLEATAPLNPGAMVEFVACAFALELPEVNQNASPELKFRVDNVSREITRHVRAAQEYGSPIELTYRAYTSGATSAPQNNPVLTLEITSVRAEAYTVTATASFPNLANKQFPGVDYDLRRFPGLAS